MSTEYFFLYLISLLSPSSLILHRPSLDVHYTWDNYLCRSFPDCGSLSVRVCRYLSNQSESVLSKEHDKGLKTCECCVRKDQNPFVMRNLWLKAMDQLSLTPVNSSDNKVGEVTSVKPDKIKSNELPSSTEAITTTTTSTEKTKEAQTVEFSSTSKRPEVELTSKAEQETPLSTSTETLIEKIEPKLKSENKETGYEAKTTSTSSPPSTEIGIDLASSVLTKTS